MTLHIFSFKITLIMTGLALLHMISEGIDAPIILLIGSVLIFMLAHSDSSFQLRMSKLCRYFSAVTVAFLLIVALNLMGLIGTLNGSNNQGTNFAALLAAPFYILSIAAYYTDVASGKMQRASLVDYLIYVCFPFKLLAGPLESTTIINRIQDLTPRLRMNNILVAWPWIILGIFMKFVVANRLNPSFNMPSVDPIGALITGAVFELKFYFDFAGYSFIAYGASLIFGLRISRNFEHPFFTRNVVMFWRHWHMSLGRFLSRYILEPNLRLIKSRKGKEVFAASIFLISAMWHGGTGNYLIWGLFHGICYYLYIKLFKFKNVNRWVGLISMVSFLVVGRLIAVDPDFYRLITKLSNILNPFIYLEYLGGASVGYMNDSSEAKALVVALLFLVFEAVSLRRYSRARPYHLFRKPFVSLILLLMVLLASVPSGNLLYARI